MELKNERETLMKVRDMLSKPQVHGQIFSMDTGGTAIECGTIACIGGWAWLIENPKASPSEASGYVSGIYVNHHDTRLTKLYYPEATLPYESITRAQAVQAIDAYLAGADDPWEGIAQEEEEE